jgi:hypothetical protein
MVEIGDKVFVKTDDESIDRMRRYLTNGKIIRHIINNPDEIYEVAYKDKHSVVLYEFINMDSKYIPKECVEPVQNQLIHRIRRESTRF